jgi:hypothetical protein
MFAIARWTSATSILPSTNALTIRSTTTSATKRSTEPGGIMELANAALVARLRAVERVLRKKTGAAQRLH